MSYMLNEFLSAPEVVRNVAKRNSDVIHAIAEEFHRRNIANITTVARGTSDNAATYFKYLAEMLGGVMVSKFSPSITTVYGAEVFLGNNMVMALSQSGMSPDTIMVLQSARKTGALTVAVTNNPESPLAKSCDFHIDLAAGEERSVGATKSFVAQLSAMFLLAAEISGKSDRLDLGIVPAHLSDFIDHSNAEMREFAQRTKFLNNYIILSRGILQAVASELSLKMMENCYTFSRPFSTCEFMHGAISMVEEGTNVVMLAPDSEFREEFIDMARRLSLLGANIVAFTDIKEVFDIATYAYRMPTIHTPDTAFFYTMAIELYVAYMAQALGRDPDAPRNRKKITMTK